MTSEARQTRMEIIDCPNPNCDPEEGCCVCEHTGKIRQWVLDEMLEDQPSTE